jgi:hypothetical protein
MLYIFHSIVLLIWLIYIVKKEKYSLHAVITVYLFFIMIVDIPEILFNQLLEIYKFPTQLLSNFNMDNQFGIIFSDGIILPITNILLLHYSTKIKGPWKVSLCFAVIMGTLEWVYLKTGYLIYFKWNIWISIGLYFSFSRFFISYSSRFLLYKPPIPYYIRIAASTYSITAWFGAVLGGAFIGLYQWRPYIFKHYSADDRFCDLGISWILATLVSITIPIIKPKFRFIAFILFFLIVLTFSYYANFKGWLVYNRWNYFLTFLRWVCPLQL